MFAPEGLINLIDVKSACHTLALDRFPEVCAKGDVFNFQINPRAELYAELLLYRFIDAHDQEMWIYKYPNLILRASPQLFHRSHIYQGPCPDDHREASEVINHLRAGPIAFLSHRFRVDIDWNPEYVASYGLGRIADELRPWHGAAICWRPKEWPVDIERAVRPFCDHVLFQVQPVYGAVQQPGADTLKAVYDAYIEICPAGKEASGLTWKEVEDRTGWSRRQILRSLATHGGQEHGQDVGDAVN